MANWAALQEQLTGKRVVKRAKHSIHFDNGNGSITANFSGKPCHFQDTDGLWKPIDTGLLLAGDGWYGSPHSDVKIHKDGRVKVGGYQQKSTLVNAKEGVVDGDKIVREFKFGTQYLYMTENGFRQETVIDRTPTTAEAKYLIASESGTLDSKYKRSDITAVDADGDVHEFINLGQFKKWLEGAVYPVVIDPDFSVGSSGGDTYIRSANSTNYGTSDSAQFIANRHILIRFPLESVASGSTITAAGIRFNATSGWSADGLTMNEISDANGDWGETTCSWLYKVNATTTGWAGSAGLATSGTDYKTTEFIGSSTTTYQPETENTRCDIVVSSGGLSAMEGWCGQASNNGLIFRTTKASYTFVATKEHATESFRPVLTVTYTTGSTGTLRRTNMNAQMSNLTGGMHG